MLKAHIILGILIGLIVVLLLIIRRYREYFEDSCSIKTKGLDGKVMTITLPGSNVELEDYVYANCFNAAILAIAKSKGLKDSKKRLLMLYTLPELTTLGDDNTDAITAVCNNAAYNGTDLDASNADYNSNGSFCKTLQINRVIKFTNNVAAKIQAAERMKLFTSPTVGVCLKAAGKDPSKNAC